ncbi:MAG TPA: AI-2E family transporter [Vicinamibacterales bacterium]|nr:AI-2E family transporter [Vicinamibacterales bacterium]
MPLNTHRILTWATFLAVAAGAVYVCLAILRPFASVIAWSGVLAIICYPLHQRLQRKTGRVVLSALVTSLVAVLAILIPMLALTAIAVSQGITLAQSVHGRFGAQESLVAQWIQQHVGDWGARAGQYTVSFATGLFEAVVSSVFIVIALFLLLRDGDDLVRAIPDLLPFERERSEALLRRIKDVVQASVYGVVVIAALQGVLYGLMFALLGVPSAILWSVVTMFASVFPVVGAFAVWGPAAGYLAFTGHWPQTIVLVLWAFVVNAIDHIVRPRLVAGRVGLSELAMFFALLGGFSVFGGLGVVLGPVTFATVAAIAETLRERDLVTR